MWVFLCANVHAPIVGATLPQASHASHASRTSGASKSVLWPPGSGSGGMASWELSFSNLTMLRPVGEGSFAKASPTVTPVLMYIALLHARLLRIVQIAAAWTCPALPTCMARMLHCSPLACP